MVKECINSVADLRFHKGGFKSSPGGRGGGGAAHFLIEELLEVNEMQVV